MKALLTSFDVARQTAEHLFRKLLLATEQEMSAGRVDDQHDGNRIHSRIVDVGGYEPIQGAIISLALGVLASTLEASLFHHVGMAACGTELVPIVPAEHRTGLK